VPRRAVQPAGKPSAAAGVAPLHVGHGEPARVHAARPPRFAGIMGAKQTAALIPLCHPLPLSSAAVDLRLDARSHAVAIEARVRTAGPTGVEMEALTAVAAAALTVYDMCKARV
jgi:cyclic pyranopterin phosphate synthase